MTVGRRRDSLRDRFSLHGGREATAEKCCSCASPRSLLELPEGGNHGEAGGSNSGQQPAEQAH
jgi:hypothetical protein